MTYGGIQPTRVYIRARFHIVIQQYIRVFATNHTDMKFFGVILLLAVASCHASSEVGNVKRSAIDDGLAKLVEEVREKMINGDEELGIPVCEPLEIENFPFEIDGDSAQLKGNLTDLKADGLSGFTADTLTFSVIGVRFTYCFNWKTINVTSGYTLDGTVINVIPIYGTGEFEAEVSDLGVCGTLALSVSGGYLYVRTSTVTLTLGDLNLKMTGLLNDDDISALVSAVVSDMVPQIVDDFDTQISAVLNELIISIGSEVLGTMTLAELLALIRG